MTSILSENQIEQLAIKLVQSLGYIYKWGPEIAPDGEHPQRQSYEDVLLVNRLEEAIQRLNPKIPSDARQDALKQVERIKSPDIITNNKTFHRMLTEGVNVTYQKDGSVRGDLVWLVGFKHPEKMNFGW